MKKNNFRKMTILFIAFIFFIITILNYDNVNQIYKNIFLWPLTYLLSYSIFYLRINNRKRYNFSTIVVLEILFVIKYVVYPMFLSLTPYEYTGIDFISTPNDTIYLMTILGSVEIISIFILAFLLHKNKKDDKKVLSFKESQDPHLKFKGNILIYMIMVLVMLLLFVLFGYEHNLISFLKSPTGQTDVLLLMLVKEMFMISMTLLYLMLLDFLVKKHNKKDFNFRLLIYFLILFISLIYVNIMDSTARFSQLYPIIVVMYLLIILLPNKRKPTFLILSASALSVFLILTFAREGGTDNWIGSLENLTSRIQVYLGGPLSSASSVHVLKENVYVNNFQFIFDNLRSIFGLNFYFRNKGFTSSQMYNLYLSNGLYPNGQLVFTTSYSYVYFGLVGSSITILVNFALIMFFNKLFYQSTKYELKFLYGIVMLRFISALFTDTPSFLTYATQYLVIFGLLILFASLFHKKRLI